MHLYFRYICLTTSSAPKQERTGADYTVGRVSLLVTVFMSANSRASVLDIVQCNDTCKWLKSTWTLRLYDPNQVAGFLFNVWLAAPLCPLFEGSNVIPHPTCPICVSVWLHSSVLLLILELFSKISAGKVAAWWPIKMCRVQRLETLRIATSGRDWSCF